MKYTLLIIFSVLLFIGCKKEGPKLPPATQTGANTFGAVVNGNIWVPRGNGFSLMSDGNNIVIDVGYSPTTTSETKLYFLVNDLQDQYGSGFNIYSSAALQEGKSYPVQVIGSALSNSNIIHIDYHVKAEDYYPSAPLTGQFTVTKLDLVNKIFSGNFYFDAVNANGNKVSVTDGRFDVKLK
jgi:hypothetical protein